MSNLTTKVKTEISKETNTYKIIDLASLIPLAVELDKLRSDFEFYSNDYGIGFLFDFISVRSECHIMAYKEDMGDNFQVDFCYLDDVEVSTESFHTAKEAVIYIVSELLRVSI